jgi:ethanolamine ammonia-lyase small subunit
MSEVPDLWSAMRAATTARIGLPRAGTAIATRDHLAFQRAHAEARDAVHDGLDTAPILDGLVALRISTLRLHSQAIDRQTYLMRPDLGRVLDAASRDAFPTVAAPCDVVFVVADGLSSRAVAAHALPLLHLLVPALRNAGWRIGPAAVVEQGRVAIADEIGELCQAALSVILIGERPGLSAADSLGLYITWAPQVGRSDAERNCLSNIRPAGMAFDEAAQRAFHLCTEARRRGFSGVNLKDETVAALLPKDSTTPLL